MKVLGLIIGLSMSATAANADGLKVFGPEFCHAYDAGACINFHYKDLKDAKTWLGKYKYPKGRAAYDSCAASAGGDISYARCAMIFHKAEQSAKVRSQMCSSQVKMKYYNVASQIAYYTYISVWNCK